LPQFTPIQKENIISLVDKVITQKRNSQIIDTSTLEKQIDDMVYQLYDLTDEEIAIIEGSINGK
jgi:adenine-specific DNA-methyltransferase